jgi:RHS repeat-associated protein
LTRTYAHNARGERVLKRNPANPAGDTTFVYDEAGRLLGEYGPGGSVQEYVWLDDTLVAVLSNHAGSHHQYVLTDHLGTPRAVVHPGTNAVVWRWDLTGSAFGRHPADSNPDGDGAQYTFNLRYPGQYYDAESRLHYNYFRDYDPSTGRYVQSDPIGLAGGLNTFAYVDGAPLRYTDPLGLRKWHGTPSIVFAGVRGSTVYISLVGELHSECYDKDYEYNGERREKMADLAMNFGEWQYNTIGTEKIRVAVSMEDGTGPDVVPSSEILAGTARVSVVVRDGQLSGTITMGNATGTISGPAKGVLGKSLDDGPLEFSGKFKPGVFQEQPCGCTH